MGKQEEETELGHLEEELEEEVEEGLEEKVEKKKSELFRKCIPRLKPETLVKLDIDGKVTAHHYICHACKDHMLNKLSLIPL